MGPRGLRPSARQARPWVPFRPVVLRALRSLLGLDRPADPLRPLAEVPSERLRLVVGLGNPGAAYAETRHSVGFQAVDLLARRLGAEWRDDRERTSSLLAVARTPRAVPLVLAKPWTFMNASGQALVALADTLSLSTEQILVVYDDMDLPLGSLRLRVRGSAGTHNGMRSVVAMLGTEDVPRLRLGISQAGSRDARDHVLSPFDEDERAAVEDLLDRAARAALLWAEEGATAAMNQFNR